MQTQTSALVQEGLSCRSILERYLRVREKTTQLCKPLSKEDYVVQPVVDISPPKWHLGHTSWFFENFVLIPGKADYRVYDKDYNYLFNSYYDSVGDRVARPDRGFLSRPTVDEIYSYRAYVDQEMMAFLEELTDEDQYVLEVVMLGLQHEQQHQELLVTDLKYILGHNPLFPPYLDPALKPATKNAKAPELQFIEIPEGMYEIGFEGKGFHFDNEKGRHKVFLHTFKVANRLVTNGEYIKFIEAGGYEDFRFWLSEGWGWVQEGQRQAPMYWHKKDGEWYHFTLYGLLPVNAEEPLTHISYYEAEAFAQWSGKRLLTEFEWEAACGFLQPEIPEQANFLNKECLMPVTPARNDLQFFGDAWEWTSSAYSAYPYYKKQEGALGEYNGKFMINQQVLRGGSCVTSGDHIRRTYRNFFHPHLQWQFTGIRLAAYV